MAGVLTGLCLYMAKLTFLWYDYFGENQTPQQRNGIAAITKIVAESFFSVAST